MADYPSNSKFNKAEKKDRPKVEKVIEGRARTRRTPFSRKLASTFTEEDVSSVSEYVIFDVAVPAAKSMLLDMVSEGFERMLFGTSKRRRSSSGGTSYTSYSSYSRQSKEPAPRTMSRAARARHQFDELILESRADAEEALDKLNFLIEEYGVATVSDLYDAVGMDSGEYTDDKWGWTDMADSSVRRIREGYLLDVPKPKPID